MERAVAIVVSGGVRIIAHGLNQQLFAIALPKGATTLKAEIDGVLVQLRNEGRTAQLARQYLGLSPEEVLPLPTPAPVPTSAPTPVSPSCIDGMNLLLDIMAYPLPQRKLA